MKKIFVFFLTFLSLFLLGTVIVLTTVRALFGVDWRDVIVESEMYAWESWSMDQEVGEEIGMGIERPEEDMKIPKIIHQTWKNEILPEKYRDASRECREMHPDYEYILWTDAGARDFIAENYDWFLPTFDGYKYNIERADAIRYFILHHYGGFYLDLDVGCKRSMEPLRFAPAILPQTIPVGISNDIMASRKNHPFWDMAIHNLRTFDRNWGINYPTVMFSTGPMFISFQYKTWPYRHGKVVQQAENEVRVLPKRWYGKNLGKDENGELGKDAFWKHFYGSSWHEDDAGFITFLGKFGMVMMYIGAAIVVVGFVRLVYNRSQSSKSKKSNTTAPRPLTFLATQISLPSLPEGTAGVLYYLPVWLSPYSPNPANSNIKQPWSWVPFSSGFRFSGNSATAGYSALPTDSQNNTDYEDSEAEDDASLIGGSGGRRRTVKMSKLRRSRKRSGTLDTEEGFATPSGSDRDLITRSSAPNVTPAVSGNSQGGRFFPWFTRRRRNSSPHNPYPTILDQTVPLISSTAGPGSPSRANSPLSSPGLTMAGGSDLPPYPGTSGSLLSTGGNVSGGGLNDEVDRFLKEMEPRVVITPAEDEDRESEGRH